ncbi:signal transduction histidine kinase [Bacillus pakistanensis]|uniref:Signal transduction histidine-protein kinase ArlS n=1 Tax=Rossellomorea pakistanensis TaxID=992288 RepID=A0ABS2N8I4_9BACI|nr:HAMP domain-containing histidine kinase [Bacillus pakistanensis]MBM7584143.1 signal transduction histidine kinase [Bacillus pakistanensis]
MNKWREYLKPTSLKIKWALGAGATIFFAFFTFSFFQYHAIDKWMLQEEESSFNRVLDELTVFYTQRGPKITLEEIYDSRDLLNQIIEKDQTIRVLDRTGKEVLVLSSDHVPRYYVPFNPVKDKVVALLETNDKQIYVGRSRITSEQFTGYVELIQPLTRYEHVMSNLFWMMTFSGVGALILSALFGYLLAKNFVKPLNKLSGTMRTIQKEGFQEKMEPIHSHDEISELSTIFNELMEKLEKSFNQQQQFVEDASHELRTPVQILEGHLSLLNRWGKKDPKVLEESLHASLQELQRVKKLVEELLDLTRTEREITDFSNEYSIVDETVEKIVKDFKFLHQNEHFKIIQMTSHPTKAIIQTRHLEQVLTILLDNAVKYSEKNSTTSIKIEEVDGFAKVSVKDQGFGIPIDDIPKVFNRFYRVDKARSREEGGNGLGLAIAKKIVEIYGGEISVQQNNGKGSTFQFLIPIVK